MGKSSGFQEMSADHCQTIILFGIYPERIEMEEWRFEMRETRNFMCKALLCVYAFGMPIAALYWVV